MSRLSRRRFLQATGATLATLGLSQLEFFEQADRYGKAIAQSPPRKLALLVGINHYPEGIQNLGGCVTDVRMQYELLVHRFGFNPSDIVILSDEPENLPVDRLIKPPTRANILETFEQHLIAQAEAGDMVVFHYSGHGSQVVDPNPIDPSFPYNGTLVPADARMPNASNNEVDDIMGKTLFLLTSLLKTDQVTTVIDCCYSGGGIRGNSLYRSLDANGLVIRSAPSEKEKAYQAYLMGEAGLTETQLLELRQSGIAKGFALGSAQASQLSADSVFGSGQAQFKAGAFTYTLTRYLWQQSVSQPLDTVFVKLARSTHDVANESGMVQEPLYDAAKNCQECNQQSTYFIDPTTPSAEAVVTKVEGDVIYFWLGGLSSRSRGTSTSVFNLVTANGQVIGQVEQTDRIGLSGTGKLGGSDRPMVTPGMFLREQIRGVPANPTLKIGLHQSLGADLTAAQSSLSSLATVEVVPINQSSEVDYILGRMNADAVAHAQLVDRDNLPPQGSLCLFTDGLMPIPNSWNVEQPNETIAEALNNRLVSRFKMLLAGHILKSVLNTDTSTIKLDASVEPIEGRGSRSHFGTRGSTSGLDTQVLSVNEQKLFVGNKIQVRLKNEENRELYIAVLVVGSEGNLVILHPLTADAAEVDALLPAGETLIVPQSIASNEADSIDFEITGPAGFFELLVVASTDPLRDALKALGQVAGARGDDGSTPYVLEAGEAVNVMTSLLGDLDRSTRSGNNTLRGDDLGVDTTKLAAISAIFEVVE